MHKRYYIFILLVLAAFQGPLAKAQVINTIAGINAGGLSGDTGPAYLAELFYPTSVAIDHAGNLLISDAANRRIRKINALSGIITTVAGTGCGFGCVGFSGDGGPATSAQFYYPNGIVVDTTGNMYIPDFNHFRIRKVNTSGIINTIAGNGSGTGAFGFGVPATSVSINFANVAVDKGGNVYFGDGYYFSKVSPSGYINYFVGSGVLGFGGDGGPATAALLNGSGYIAMDTAGNFYIDDFYNYRVRKVNPAGIISTVVGNGTPGNSGDGGPATNASINPVYVSVDKIGNLYVTDSLHACIRKVDIFGTITTIAGNGTPGFSGDGGAATMAKLFEPGGVAVDNFGNIFIADGTNNRIRKISFGNHQPRFVNGHSQSMTACQYSVHDSINSLLSIADSDISQAETWSAATLPLHGTLTASGLGLSTGGIITPTGLTYTPTYGYTGPDSFKMLVTDGMQSDTTTIHVTVNLSPGSVTGPSSSCTGMSFTLTDTFGTGTWSSSNNSIATVGSLSGLVSGTGSGIVTITYTPGSGCFNTKTITINAVPTAITAPAGVCTGSTTTFSDGVPGGTWTSTNTSIATVNSATGLVMGITPGPDSIIYSTSPGCSVGILTSVYPLPAAITGPSQVCPLSTLTLSDVTPSGYWYSSNPGTATVGLGTGIVTGVAAGFVTISYSVTTLVTCSITKTITVNPTAGTISGTPHLCVGGLGTLTDPGGGTWLSSAPTIANIGSSSGIVVAYAPGTTVITYSLTTGCNSSIVFTINPLPAAISGSSAVCAGSSVTLTDPGGGTWTSSNNAIASFLSAGVVSGISTGTATVTYTLSTGCSATMPVTVAPVPPAIIGSADICVGTTTILADSITGGTWSSFTPSVATVNPISGTVAAISVGTTNITYTSPLGCFVSEAFVVEALPTAYTISGGGTLCAGGTGFDISLSGSSHSCHYQLFNSGTPGLILAGSGSALDFGLQTAAGIYTINATNLSNGCSNNMTGTATIIVNPLPAPISGPSAVCIGSTIAETDAGGGIWTSSLPSRATIGSSTGIVTGISIGTTTITYTLPTSCYVTSTITVSSTPSEIAGPSTVCTGSFITLADTIPGGAWASSNTAIATVGSLSGMVTGVSNGTVTISYSFGSGCIKTKSITVNPLPAGITGTLGICTGHTTTLSDVTPGGTWSSGTTSVATVGTGSGIVLGAASGTSSIRYTTASGCSVASTVTVNAGPSGIGGNLHTCTGQTTALTDSASGGWWSIIPTTIATIGTSTGVVTGVAPGMAIVTYSLGSGCTTSSVVTVNAGPSPISGPTAVCVASTISLTDTTTGGVWSSSNASLATISGTGLVTGVNGGNVVLSYTLAGCSATMPVTVYAIPATITGASGLCVGATTTLSDATPGGSWSSSLPAYATVGSSSGIVTGVAAGSTIITYTTGAGCRTTRGITVNAIPPAISGGTELCVGSVITLSDATPGGAWLLGPGSAVSLGTSGIVTGLSLGTAVISYIVSGCAAITTVTVGPLPPAISGPHVVCSGSTITLTDAGVGTWSSGTPSIASVGTGSGIVTGGTAGLATIIYSLGPGCNVSTTVNVLPLPSAISGPSSLCTGATATLTDPVSGGVWSSSAPAFVTVGSTGTINGISNGTAVISYLVSSGCSATKSVSSVTVPPIMMVHNICAFGDTMTVSDSITSGLFTSSLATVTNLGGGLGRVTGNTPGYATITYSIAGGCSATKQFTVNPTPGHIAGVLPLCAGDSLLLTDPTTGGTWSSTGTGILTVGSSSGMVNGMADGTGSVTYTLITTGCKTDTNIVVSSMPLAGIISGTGSMCAGSSVTLTDTVSGGLWSSSGILTTVTSGVVHGLLAGTDTITYAVTNMCGTTTAAMPVTVNPVPAAGTITGTDTVCITDAITLTDTATGGIWSVSNTNASVSATGVVTGLATGRDTVTYTVSNAWCSASTNYIVTIVPLSFCISLGTNSGTEAPGESIQVWPNPSGGDITVYSSRSETLRLLTIDGRYLADYVINKGETHLPLPPGLSDGVYILEFVNNDLGRTVMKLIIGR